MPDPGSFFLVRHNMSDGIVGPGKLGKAGAMSLQVRVDPQLLESIDRWIAHHAEPRPSRPEAIRHLLLKSLLEHSG